MNEIVILQQIADTITLYSNCFKRGYKTIQYFTDQANIYTVAMKDPTIIISGLMPGTYYFYAENDNGNDTGHFSVDISGLSKDTIFSNILLNRQIEIPDNILASLSIHNYLLELYQQLLQNKISEEAFLAFVEFYNAQQEELNTNVPEFSIQDQTISSQTELSYRFIPFLYDSISKTWSQSRTDFKEDTDQFVITGKPCSLHQILVLSDFKVVRKYYIYLPSENVSTAILEGRIQTRQNKSDLITKQIVQLNLQDIVNDLTGQNVVASLLYYKPTCTIFHQPDIVLENTNITCHISDFPCIQLIDRPLYLAMLELNEVFAEHPHPHRHPIISESFAFRTGSLLLNSDTEYVCYITDETDAVLSDVTLISLNPNFPSDIYTTAYRRVVYDEYVRKLNSIFKAYAKDKWDTAALSLEQYLFYQDTNDRLYEFLWKQLLRLNPDREPIEKLIGLVELCQLQYYDNIDQTFIPKQVYSKEFHDHVFPEWNALYIVRAIHFNGNDITYTYHLAGDESFNIKMNKDDYLLLQCIDPKSWKMSSAALYNNRIKSGTPYIYFPKLEVEVI